MGADYFEVHILDFDRDIYGASLTVHILYKLRDNQQFLSEQALICQIQKDIKNARSRTIIGLAFGTFDYFHAGHEAYLREAQNRCDELHIIIARDTTVQRVK